MDALLRPIIPPSKQKITLELPENFIGKSIEILAFPIKEASFEYKQEYLVLTHIVNEASLAKDWLIDEEDKAWSTL
jgi:hypothetical protein